MRTLHAVAQERDPSELHRLPDVRGVFELGLRSWHSSRLGDRANPFLHSTSEVKIACKSKALPDMERFLLDQLLGATRLLGATELSQ